MKFFLISACALTAAVAAPLAEPAAAGVTAAPRLEERDLFNGLASGLGGIGNDISSGIGAVKSQVGAAVSQGVSQAGGVQSKITAAVAQGASQAAGVQSKASVALSKSVPQPSGVIGIQNDVKAALSQGCAQKNSNTILSALQQQKCTATQTDVQQAMSTLKAIHSANPANILEYGAMLIANGLTPNNIEQGINDVLQEGSPLNGNSNSYVYSTSSQDTIASDANIKTSNPNPRKSVYPKKDACDAPYDLSESALRSAIYIPSTFTWGAKPPVILFPGTGSTGYITFSGNMIKVLSNVGWADPVWVNVPGYLLGDAQKSAEYAAYAMNYIASLTNRKVAIVAWSQGNLDAQWAFKYWPSTRKVTTDLVSVSPDFHGTVIADFIAPFGIGNDPSVVQQQYDSNFISTLRSEGGDSAYVPTTTIYSGFFDEIVEPQQGTGASAYILDARSVGVSNTEVQTVCPGQLAGSFYTHEGMLYNPISFALLKDALTHDGPGQLSRVNTASLCQQYLTQGLTLEDLLVTENSILVAGIALVSFSPKYLSGEPAISAYATQPATCSPTSAPKPW